MKFSQKTLGALAATLLLGLTGCGLQPSTSAVPQIEPASLQRIEAAEGQKITVASKNFTEQLILGKIAVLAAEASGFDVTDMSNIPGSQPARKSMTNHSSDIMWDYTGTAWMIYMGNTNTIADTQQMWQAVHDTDLAQGITWGKASPMNNTYALAARSEYAREKGITALSDIKNLPVEERTICVESEFNSRTDGLNGMLEKYGIPRGSADGVPESNIRIMDTGTVYTATDEGLCNFGEVFTTDGRIKSLDLNVLEDDQYFFPAYNLAATFNTELVEQYPQLEENFNKISEALNNDTMRELNYQVDVEGKEPVDVARDWMIQEGFIR